MIKPRALVLANLHDFSSDKVCLELSKSGTEYLRLNRDQLPELRLRLDPVEPRLEIDYDSQTWIIDKSLRKVWYRQPTYLRNPEGRVLPVEEQLSRSQWMAFMRALTVFEDAIWINDPAATFRAESKAWQLRVAKKIGFYIPATIITNDKSAAVQSSIGDSVALKSLDTVLLREGERDIFSFTQIIPWASCPEESFSLIPVTLQQPLINKVDLRVTVVGSKLWCVAVTHNGNGIEGDWRLQKKNDLSYESYSLPESVEKLCFELMDTMQLTMAGIDLAISEGKFWFIEVNPTGEWGWLDCAERPIAKTIASTLS